MSNLLEKETLSGKKILIADDSKEMRDALSTALNSYGAVVIEAENGIEALELARQDKPDMIIMDINMPEMNGIDACRSLKSEKRTKNIPVLLSSSDKLLMEVATSKMSIADDYLRKPFSLKQLLDKTIRIICPS